MATHVHAAGVILDSVSRHGDQVVWPDHPEHQTVKLVCEQLNRLDGHQNLVVELQAEVASVEAARQQELAESRVAWIQLEQQVALAQQRLSTTQSEAANERRSLLDRINQLEMRIRQDSPTMPEE